jgi:hypothetical protein
MLLDYSSPANPLASENADTSPKVNPKQAAAKVRFNMSNDHQH